MTSGGKGEMEMGEGVDAAQEEMDKVSVGV